MSLPMHVALVPDGVNIAVSEVTRVAAALAKQVSRDFSAIWSVAATVAPFTKLEDVPLDSWPIIVKRNVAGAAGYHEDENGQPYAVVEFAGEWSLTASHECLEMLADPFGRRQKAGNLLDQALALGLKHARVGYLVEVCDPSESGQFAYQINGVLVSDFYTPRYFDPVKSAGVKYSFTGAIDAPRQVLDGGYISWHDPVSRHWFQLRMFPDNLSSKIPHVIDLDNETIFGKLKSTQSIRAAIDRVTKAPMYQKSLRGAALRAMQVNRTSAVKAQEARAEAIRKQIAELIAAAAPASPRTPARRD
jgi:hypothetical protein